MRSVALFIAVGGLFLYSVYGKKQHHIVRKKRACTETVVTAAAGCDHTKIMV